MIHFSPFSKELREEEKIDPLIELTSLQDLFFDRPFFSSERVERRRDDNNFDEEYKKLMETIRAAKEDNEKKTVDGVICPVNERSPSPNEEVETTKEEKKHSTPDGEIIGIENPEITTRTSIKSHKILGPDGTFRLVFARCEKTVEENGKVITHEKEEHHFTK